jgi:hypothetical protein
MSRQTKNELKGSLIIPVGWLFADLLLALAMLFLIANTVAPPVKANRTPTPTPTIRPKPTPSPTPTLAALNTYYYDICLQVDPTKLIPGPPDLGAMQAIKNQLRSDPFLRKPGRQAGLVIPYGGTPDDLPDHEATGRMVADQVVVVLKSLGKDGFVFTRAAYHESLNDIGGNYSYNIVELQIYLFIQPDFKNQPPTPPQALTCPQ